MFEEGLASEANSVINEATSVSSEWQFFLFVCSPFLVFLADGRFFSSFFSVSYPLEKYPGTLGQLCSGDNTQSVIRPNPSSGTPALCFPKDLRHGRASQGAHGRPSQGRDTARFCVKGLPRMCRVEPVVVSYHSRQPSPA